MQRTDTPTPKIILPGIGPEGLVTSKRIFVFRCPTCRNVFRSDQEYEPMCTGPRWTNDHEPAIMQKIGGPS